MTDYREDESCQRLRRGIVALNNAGVSLLERRSHRNAANAFRSCLTFMKVQENGSAQTSLCYDISPFIAEAVRALASTDDATNQGTSSFVSVQAVSHRDNETNLLIARSICGTSTQELKPTLLLNVSPMRIELSDYEESTTLDLSLITAVVMYNYGLTLIILSSDEGMDQRSKIKLHESAMHFFTYSSALLSKKNSEADFQRLDFFQSTTMLCLSVLSLGALHQSLLQVGTTEQASRCQARLRQLSLKLRALDSYGTLLGCRGKTAPAA